MEDFFSQDIGDMVGNVSSVVSSFETLKKTLSEVDKVKFNKLLKELESVKKKSGNVEKKINDNAEAFGELTDAVFANSKSMKDATKILGALGVKSSSTTDRLKDLDNVTKKLDGSMGDIYASVGKAAVAFAGLGAMIGGVYGKAAEYNKKLYEGIRVTQKYGSSHKKIFWSGTS